MMYVIWAALTFASIQVRRKSLEIFDLELVKIPFLLVHASHLRLCTHYCFIWRKSKAASLSAMNFSNQTVSCHFKAGNAPLKALT